MNIFFEHLGWLFEWDSEKESRNVVRHGVGFQEAAILVRGEDSLIEADYKHSASEERWAVMGPSPRGRPLLVTLTYRETNSGRTIHRIVSAHEVSTEGIHKHRRRLAVRWDSTDTTGRPFAVKSCDKRELGKSFPMKPPGTRSGI